MMLPCHQLVGIYTNTVILHESDPRNQTATSHLISRIRFLYVDRLIEEDAGGLFETALNGHGGQRYRAIIGPGQITGADQQHQRGVG